MCRDILQKNSCPRGANCNFAHSEDELEKYVVQTMTNLAICFDTLQICVKTISMPIKILTV